jgi:hypothetical protein
MTTREVWMIFTVLMLITVILLFSIKTCNNWNDIRCTPEELLIDPVETDKSKRLA